MLALAPGVGDVDVVVASELMEAGRAVAVGFVTPDRTLSIASTSRFLVMARRSRWATAATIPDGWPRRSRRIRKAHSCSTWTRSRARTGAFINAVMLGVIAGCGRLPIPVEAFEAAIRADGKAVEGNLRGFRAGLEAAQAPEAARAS